MRHERVESPVYMCNFLAVRNILLATARAAIMVAVTGRNKIISAVLVAGLLVTLLLYHTVPLERVSSIVHHSSPAAKEKETKPEPTPRVYKEKPTPAPPIVDNFPLAADAQSPRDLPPIPSWNTPPSPHVQESTPLLIGFTRNWRMLQQAVVSYITAGWPPEDIYVVENTGTMNANKNGHLTLQNPFYLDYRRLTQVLGVNILSTPTLLTFAQLQNFYLHTAISNEWEHYFWSHMDVVALSREDWDDLRDDDDYKSLYVRCVEDLRATLKRGYNIDGHGDKGTWAIRFYAYDRLALMNRYAFEQVGGWDVVIPYYGTDCDMYERLTMNKLVQANGHVGLVYDIGRTLKDLIRLYRRRPDPEEIEADARFRYEEDDRGSHEWAELRDRLNSMQVDKNNGDRNTWQEKQEGGQGEPYYRDPAGFETALKMWMDFGKDVVMAEKWGHRGCNLRGVGLKAGDEWRVEHDW
ncbi:hypothetical protein LTR37_017104 [Vermiconidia calcicola]|uniref:Uncharacterized protein n=1 Tax=Vermiconidia calcicola TaxID=1690605 RepID=A0ACC3MKV1_9PEZI|nr:hypothetical protein LTR37_017104 [Vermiconidia calcicola]